FTTAVPFGVLSKLLESSKVIDGLTPLDRERSKSIADYITRNRSSYVLSAITLSVDGECQFALLDSSTSGVSAGTLTLPINAAIRIHDGQYRVRGIADAIAAEPQLADETLSVVIYQQLSQSARRFGDIKANQRKPGRSERIISDPTDALANITREVIAKVPAFTDSIEMVKTTISNRSRNLFTFSALYQANEILLAGQQDQTPSQQAKFAIAFWQSVQEAMPDWTSDAPRVDLRKNTVHAHGVTLCAIAKAGASLISRFPKGWQRKLRKLKAIDWSRSNTKQWEGKAMLGGRMTKSAASIKLTAEVISRHLS
ncbi:MAG: DNA sulfur modification protein DndB, partial [Planctomycetota bacterium]